MVWTEFLGAVGSIKNEAAAARVLEFFANWVSGYF
jgi:hypothetical protein